VRQRERDHDAVAADPAPALRQVPEEGLQAPVHARELRDGLGRREPQRALGEPVEESGGDLRVLGDLGGEAAVQDGERGGGEDAPLGVHGQQLALGGGLPGADQVARPEQLGAHVVGHDELAGDDAVEHEQADVIRARLGQARDVPRPDSEAMGAHEQPALGVRAARLREQRPEVGVCLEQGDLFRSHGRVGCDKVVLPPGSGAVRREPSSGSSLLVNGCTRPGAK
jgi:hypothetical protein